MLKNQLAEGVDLVQQKHHIATLIPEPLKEFIDTDDEITELQYPVIDYPQKVKSINLDKTAEVKDKLTGIKGQYLIFESGNVLNVRKHTGYEVNIQSV